MLYNFSHEGNRGIHINHPTVVSWRRNNVLFIGARSCDAVVDVLPSKVVSAFQVQCSLVGLNAGGEKGRSAGLGAALGHCTSMIVYVETAEESRLSSNPDPVQPPQRLQVPAGRPAGAMHERGSGPTCSTVPRPPRPPAELHLRASMSCTPGVDIRRCLASEDAPASAAHLALCLLAAMPASAELQAPDRSCAGPPAIILCPRYGAPPTH
jgi:hypothetical protein